jgi:hypothetical protein
MRVTIERERGANAVVSEVWLLEDTAPEKKSDR